MDDRVPAAALARMAGAMRILAMDGHDDITLGHMSMREASGRGVWIKKAQRGIDEVHDRDHFVLIDWEGAVLENPGPCHSEWPIHTQILKARPDLNVVGHTHARFSVLFSATAEELAPLNHEGANLAGRLSRFNKTAGLINTRELGDELAASLGGNAVVLLKNHGIAFAGSTLEEATINGLFLERACRMPILLSSTGLTWSAPDEAGHDRKMGNTPDAARQYQKSFFEYFQRRLDRMEDRQAGGRRP